MTPSLTLKALFSSILLTYAIPLTPRERQEAVWMPLFDILWQKVIRIKFLSIITPNVRSSMESIKIDDKCDTRWNLIII